MSDTEVDTGAAVSLILVLFFSSLCMCCVVLCRVVRMRMEQNAIEERNGRMDGTSLLFSSRNGEVPGSSNPSRLLLPSSYLFVFGSSFSVVRRSQLSIVNCQLQFGNSIVMFAPRNCCDSSLHSFTHSPCHFFHVYILYSQ